MKPTVISFVNMKGGVAKTTTTVGLATVLSGDFKKNVLVIDLDPQTNATGMLMGEEAWEQASLAGHTLYNLFHDAAFGSDTFSIEESIQKNVSKIKNVDTLDLLPSDIHLMDLEFQMANPEEGLVPKPLTIHLLKDALAPVIENYDYILIDCPPNLGMFTLNGLYISDYYIIPTIPDILSTRGIHSMIHRVPKFVENVPCMGIVYTKVRKQAGLHQRIMAELGHERAPKTFEEKLRNASIQVPIFKTIFYENNNVAQAADFIGTSSLLQKWGNHGHYDSLVSFAKEIFQIVEPEMLDTVLNKKGKRGKK